MKTNEIPCVPGISFVKSLFTLMLVALFTSCTDTPFSTSSDNNYSGGKKVGILEAEGTINNLSTLCGCANNCTLTQGYWKNHGPAQCSSGNNQNEWPAHVMSNGLYLGNVLYSPSQLCTILNTPSGGKNKTISLQHQLIAAKLNLFKGADPTAALSQILAADQWLISGGPIGTLIADLTAFNEGLIGPGHCGAGL